VPLSRPDITNPEDLLEELLRTYGYNNLTGSLPTSLPTTNYNRKNERNEKQKKTLQTYLTNQG